MSEYEAKLGKVLYAIYRLNKRMPGEVSNKNIEDCLKRNHPDFVIGETDQLLQGLEDYGCINQKIFLNGNEKGYVTLNSFGVQNAEKYEKQMTPTAGEIVKQEVEDFLRACCEKAEYQLDVEFNVNEVASGLGFDWGKTKQYWHRLRDEGYLRGIGISTTSNSRTALTPKALNAVNGPIFGQATGVTNVTKNEINIGGSVHNSVVAAGEGIAQSLSITQEQRNGIEEFLGTARAGLADLNLDDDTESDYNSHLSVIEGTLADDNPQPEVVKKELRGLKRIAEAVGIGAAGGAGGTGIVEAVNALLPLLG